MNKQKQSFIQFLGVVGIFLAVFVGHYFLYNPLPKQLNINFFDPIPKDLPVITAEKFSQLDVLWNGRNHFWSDGKYGLAPDGKHLVVSKYNNLYLLETQNQTMVLRIPTTEFFGVFWSGDSKKLLIVQSASENGYSLFTVIDLTTYKVSNFVPNKSSDDTLFSKIAWMTDNKTIVYADKNRINFLNSENGQYGEPIILDNERLITQLAVTKDYVVYQHHNQSKNIVNLSTREKQILKTDDQNLSYWIELKQDNQLVFFMLSTHLIQWYDIEKSALIEPQLTGTVNQIAVSPDLTSFLILLKPEGEWVLQKYSIRFANLEWEKPLNSYVDDSFSTGHYRGMLGFRDGNLLILYNENWLDVNIQNGELVNSRTRDDNCQGQYVLRANTLVCGDIHMGISIQNPSGRYDVQYPFAATHHITWAKDSQSFFAETATEDIYQWFIYTGEVRLASEAERDAQISEPSQNFANYITLLDGKRVAIKEVGSLAGGSYLLSPNGRYLVGWDVLGSIQILGLR
ncbi:MAG TPA: hypothetical protein PK299_03370 [Anaerolineales bacterium]|nr:hypothetical protein [Anaerolineales bacterium]